jgi:hypothetical protein
MTCNIFFTNQHDCLRCSPLRISNPKESLVIEFYKMLISICLLLAINAHAESLEVLHWWTSISERRAADILVERLSKEAWEWKNAAVPSGRALAQ